MNDLDRMWITTYTGKKFYPFGNDLESICIQDIAHALSMLCRFGGHCSEFYSVAQHSIHVANLLPDELKIHGLIHDATEAYIVDIPSPIKRNLYLGSKTMDEVELQIETRIYNALKIKFPNETIRKEVKKADDSMFATEARDLLSKTHDDLELRQNPQTFKIEPMSSFHAEFLFIDMWEQLKEKS